MYGLIFGFTLIQGVPVLPALIACGVYVAIFSLLMYFGQLSPGIYNTDYRRTLNVLHEMFSRLKADKQMKPADKARYVELMTKLIKDIEVMKPLFEDTAVQRFVLWMTHGSDAKFINIEHYTQSLANHSVNVLNERFKLI